MKPIVGLNLNSFIPHFEPLYYDQHKLLRQYEQLVARHTAKVNERRRRSVVLAAGHDQSAEVSPVILNTKDIQRNMGLHNSKTNATTTTAPSSGRDISNASHLSPQDVITLGTLDASDSGHRAHDGDFIRIQFTAHNRLFSLKLFRDPSRVFATDTVIESTTEAAHLHPHAVKVVHGHLEGMLTLMARHRDIAITHFSFI